ncbi:MAG: peptidyl-prolyl cis-trans isomerase [Nitrospirae bacterium]|nr:peptidyl-prolyl cis-trans isomerase [Nitrospirota bacterium]
MFNRILFIAGALVILGTFLGCETQKTSLPDGVVARLNGQDITVEEFRMFCGGMIPDNPDGKKNKLSGMIDRRLASEVARKEGMLNDPEVVSEVLKERNSRLAEMMRAKVDDETKLDESEVPEPEIEAGTVVELYQIINKDMDMVEKARAEVLSGKKFEEVAFQYSTGISAKGGGFLGEVFLPGSVYPFGVKAIINKLAPGEVSPVVKEDMGYAIFMVKSKKETAEVLEQMREKLREEALKAKKEKALADLLARLLKENKVEYNEKFFAGKDPFGWVVRVNGQELTVNPESLESTDPFHQPHQAVGEKQLRYTANRVVSEILLGQEAMKRNLHITPEFLMDSRLAEEDVLAGTYIRRKFWSDKPPTEEELKGFYEKHRSEFTRPARVKLSRILVFTPGEADRLLAELKGGADFASLAAKYSKDKSAEVGGDVGFVYEGNTLEPIGSVVFKMKPGDISGALKTKYGFEIVKVTESRPGGIVPMEEMMDKLTRKVILDGRTTRVSAFYKKLRDAADLQVNSELMKDLKD